MSPNKVLNTLNVWGEHTRGLNDPLSWISFSCVKGEVTVFSSLDKSLSHIVEGADASALLLASRLHKVV